MKSKTKRKMIRRCALFLICSGVRVVSVDEGDSVIGISCIENTDEPKDEIKDEAQDD